MPYLSHASIELLLYLADAVDSGAYANYEEEENRDELVKSLQDIAIGVGLNDRDLRQAINRYFGNKYEMRGKTDRICRFEKGTLYIETIYYRDTSNDYPSVTLSLSYDGETVQEKSNCVRCLGKEDGTFYHEHFMETHKWRENYMHDRIKRMYHFFQQPHTYALDYSHEEQGTVCAHVLVNNILFSIEVEDRNISLMRAPGFEIYGFTIRHETFEQKLYAWLEEQPAIRLFLL